MIVRTAAALLAATLLAATAPNGARAEPEGVKNVDFSFEGPFGRFDQAQLQRGFQVFKEVCSACHGLKFVAARELTLEGGPRFSEDQVKAFLEDAGWEVADPEGEPGDTRAMILADRFPAVTSAGAPDLSLMTKARAGFEGPQGLLINQIVNGMGGPEYLYSIVSGYTGEEKEEAGAVIYENPAMPGGWIAMPPPLAEDLVEYQDGTPATVEQMAEDVAAFLTWTAEPHMEARKRAGVRNVIWLAILAALLYLTNKALWAAVKRRKSA